MKTNENITPQRARELHGEDAECTIIDVREPNEFARCHIPSAVNIPLAQLADCELPEAERYLVCCQSGVRAQAALTQLQDRVPSKELLVMDGGLNEWQRASFPVNEDTSMPISIERQVRIAAGALVVLGTILGATVSDWFFLVPAFVGSGLVFAGVTNTCGMARLLQLLPYNR